MAESLSAEYDRRHFLQTMVAGAAIPLLRPAQAQEASVLMKVIPSTQERIPAVGLGSWITFNVGKDVLLRDECAAVMAAFFDSGGRLIDSSPMYGSAQAVIGYGLKKSVGRTRYSLRTRYGLPRQRTARRKHRRRLSNGACRASICCRFTIC